MISPACLSALPQPNFFIKLNWAGQAAVAKQEAGQSFGHLQELNITKISSVL